MKSIKITDEKFHKFLLGIKLKRGDISLEAMLKKKYNYEVKT